MNNIQAGDIIVAQPDKLRQGDIYEIWGSDGERRVIVKGERSSGGLEIQPLAWYEWLWYGIKRRFNLWRCRRMARRYRYKGEK